jgi:hypothetical protein
MFSVRGAVFVTAFDDADVRPLNVLMVRGRDRSMNCRDARLVHPAERESLTSVFTVDRDDFEAYRIGGRRRLRIAPGRRQGRR